MGKQVDPFDRQKHLADIPVVDSSAVDEIPEGLVLLPAPPSVSRWRGFTLGGAALLTAAGALTIAVIGAEPPRQVGEPPLRAAHERVLAASEVPADRRGAGVEAATPGTAAAAATTPGSAASRTPSTARTEPAAQAAEDPLPGDPSATTASSQAPSAGGGHNVQDAVEEEQATTASQSPAAAPESPAEDGQPNINLPDPADTIEDVGGIVDDVTDALPIPPLLGD